VVDYGEDFLQRIVNVHWRKPVVPGGLVVQQGLLATFDNEEGHHAPGSLKARALDSGQEFPDTNMGASGLGYTVLTRGLVCFGTPRDGEPCFLACPDYFLDTGGQAEVAVLRGIKSGLIGNETDHSIEIAWQAVASGPVVALTFAAGAFFVVYQNTSDGGPTSIATSFDGRNFSAAEAYPYDIKLNQTGGAVAGLVVNQTDPSRPRTTYVSCGSLDADVDPDNPYFGIQTNLAWATSSTGLGWGYDGNMDVVGDPGSFVGQTGGTNVASAVAAGNGLFVAAATHKTVVLNDAGLPYVTHQGAVATSTSGSGWSTTALPGAVTATKNTYSSTSCVVFVQTDVDLKTGQPTGYFLCGGHGYDGNISDFSPFGGVWRSVDGHGWSHIIPNRIYNVTLSAIAKDLGSTKIARV
jgi:hypothetical protein